MYIHKLIVKKCTEDISEIVLKIMDFSQRTCHLYLDLSFIVANIVFYTCITIKQLKHIGNYIHTTEHVFVKWLIPSVTITLTIQTNLYPEKIKNIGLLYFDKCYYHHLVVLKLLSLEKKWILTKISLSGHLSSGSPCHKELFTISSMGSSGKPLWELLYNNYLYQYGYYEIREVPNNLQRECIPLLFGMQIGTFVILIITF